MAAPNAPLTGEEYRQLHNITLAQPSALQVTEALRGAHAAIRCYGWAHTEPAADRGPVTAMTAIGMGITGWGCGPRVLLSPDDERVHEAAIAAVTAHLGLNATGAPHDPAEHDLGRFAAWHDAPDRTQDDILAALQRTARILEGYHPSRVFTPTIQDMTGIHLGVALICYGEDSNYLAVGHIEPSLMVAASTACHLDLTGEPLAGGTWKPDALERSVRNEYALHWRDERSDHWFDFDPVDWRTPGSMPVTTLTVD